MSTLLEQEIQSQPEVVAGLLDSELTGPQITAFLADNVLDVFINKRPNDPGDQIEVRASVLTLSYEVPDSGSTLVLLVCSVLAVEGLRRRMAAFKGSVEA